MKLDFIYHPIKDQLNWTKDLNLKWELLKLSGKQNKNKTHKEYPLGYSGRQELKTKQCQQHRDYPQMSPNGTTWKYKLSEQQREQSAEQTDSPQKGRKSLLVTIQTSG